MARKKHIILAVDWKVSSQPFWLQSELEKLGYIVITVGIPNYNRKNREVRWRKLILWVQYLLLGWRSLRVARRVDGVVLAWNFIPGVFATILSGFFGNAQAQVITLNLLIREKGQLHSFLRDIVYRWAFTNNRTLMTVNSPWLAAKYIESFGIQQHKISVLRDPWAPDDEIYPPSYTDDGYVFSGGEDARDWDTLLAVAQICPDIPFEIIARKKNWSQKISIPSNVKIYFDTSSDEFYSMAGKSRLALLPLNSNVTAGLIVLKKTALLGRPVIATRTPAVEIYFPDQCNDLMVPMLDADEMASVLQKYWNNHEARVRKATVLQEHIKEHFSPEAYARQVGKLVEKSFSLAN